MSRLLFVALVACSAPSKRTDPACRAPDVVGCVCLVATPGERCVTGYPYADAGVEFCCYVRGPSF